MVQFPWISQVLAKVHNFQTTSWDKMLNFHTPRPLTSHIKRRGSFPPSSFSHSRKEIKYSTFNKWLIYVIQSSEKDATFIERKTQTKGAAAYELFNHPGWFMCHDTSSKFGLVAKNVDIGSHEFLFLF